MKPENHMGFLEAAKRTSKILGKLQIRISNSFHPWASEVEDKTQLAMLIPTLPDINSKV